METCDDLIQDEHYDVSSVTSATENVHTLHKQVQSKMNERQQLLESCGNFFARSMEVRNVTLRQLVLLDKTTYLNVNGIK